MSLNLETLPDENDEMPRKAFGADWRTPEQRTWSELYPKTTEGLRLILSDYHHFNRGFKANLLNFGACAAGPIGGSLVSGGRMYRDVASEILDGKTAAKESEDGAYRVHIFISENPEGEISSEASYAPGEYHNERIEAIYEDGGRIIFDREVSGISSEKLLDQVLGLKGKKSSERTFQRISGITKKLKKIPIYWGRN